MVRSERGQLILVGAIAIALILLGLVLIVNTALFTQVVGSEGTVESAKEGGVSGQEIGDSIGAVVAEENVEEDFVSTIDTDVEGAVENDLESAYAKRTVETSGSFVSMEYIDSEEPGSIIEQDSPAAIDSWDPVIQDSDVGEFLLVVNTGPSSNGEVEIDVTPDGESMKTLEVEVNGPGTEVDLTGAASCSDIRATDGTVRIDLRHGSVYEDRRCQFDLFTNGSENYDVSFRNVGDDVTGTYVIATDDTGISSEPPSVDVTEAVWRFSYEFTYESKDATVTSDRRVIDVYD